MVGGVERYSKCCPTKIKNGSKGVVRDHYFVDSLFWWVPPPLLGCVTKVDLNNRTYFFGFCEFSEKKFIFAFWLHLSQSQNSSLPEISDSTSQPTRVIDFKVLRDFIFTPLKFHSKIFLGTEKFPANICLYPLQT